MIKGEPLLVLRLEGAAVLAVSVLAYGRTDHGWGVFALLFFVPDLGMLGYLANPRTGAAVYNILHTYVLPLLLGAFGLLGRHGMTFALAAIWTAHIDFDRMLGYGLKYPTGFGETHLGRIGR